jgi:hypothetical protein
MGEPDPGLLGGDARRPGEPDRGLLGGNEGAAWPAPPLLLGDQPAHDVAAEEVEQDVEMKVRPLLRPAEQLCDVPAPHLVRLHRQELRLRVGHVQPLPPALAHLLALGQDPVAAPAQSRAARPRASHLGQAVLI